MKPTCTSVKFKLNLLEEINAISTPEKKADNKRVIMAKIKYIFIKVTK